MATTITSTDGTSLHVRDEGAGPAVVLLHGLTADGEMNWEWIGLAPALREAGFRTIVPDLRGHGRSGRPPEPAAYHDDRFVDDVGAVLDHLELDRVALVGYSLGALMALRTAPVEPRVVAVVLGGVGGRDLEPVDRDAVAAALEADDPSTIADPELRALRHHAEAMGAERGVLAALQRGRRRDPFEPGRVTVPTLVVAGADDTSAGDPAALAARLPRSEVVTVAGDHASALLDPAFTGAVRAFLARHLAR